MDLEARLQLILEEIRSESVTGGIVVSGPPGPMKELMKRYLQEPKIVFY